MTTAVGKCKQYSIGCVFDTFMVYYNQVIAKAFTRQGPPGEISHNNEDIFIV